MPDSLRIGLVTGEYPPMQGGIGAHCKVLAQTLAAQGHHVAIFTDMRAAEADPCISLTNTAKRWRGGTMRAINAWAKREQLDIVNMHFQTAAYQMSPWIHYLPGYVKTAPVITTFHDLRFPYLFPKAGRLRDWIVMRLARASAGVIATNHEDYARLTSLPHHALIPIGSSVLTDLPPDFEHETWRKRAGAANGTPLLAHFGFINHSKGVDTLLEAAALLVKSGTVLHLLMIGGRTGTSDPTNAAYADTIDAKIRALGLQPYITWTGFVEPREASAYFAAADVVVLPFRDGASYRRSSLMAVIHHECAILTTKPAVEIPTFQNGANLMMVAPENIPALAAAMQVLTSSSVLRATLREGAAKLKHHFAWETIAADNVAFFRKVISTWRSAQKHF